MMLSLLVALLVATCEAIKLTTNDMILYFHNPSSEPMTIYWEDPHNKYAETEFLTIQPGEWQVPVPTKVEHSWIIRNARSKDIFMEFRAKIEHKHIVISNPDPWVPDTPKVKPKPGQINLNYMTIEMHGVKIHYSKAAYDNHGVQMRSWLEDSLAEIERLVPADAWNLMKKTHIYVNDNWENVPAELNSRCLAWHHSTKFIIEKTGMMPEKYGQIEINSIGDTLSWADHSPSVLLHEMAHAYHWLQEKNGNYLGTILEETYDKAMKDGKYDSVKHWKGYTTKHYATTNPGEYFAETVEAFFSSGKFHNDYYPFNRQELKVFDPDGFDMVAKIFNVDTSL